MFEDGLQILQEQVIVQGEHFVRTLTQHLEHTNFPTAVDVHYTTDTIMEVEVHIMLDKAQTMQHAVVNLE